MKNNSNSSRKGVDSWFTLPNEEFLTKKYNAVDYEKVFYP